MNKFSLIISSYLLLVLVASPVLAVTSNNSQSENSQAVPQQLNNANQTHAATMNQAEETNIRVQEQTTTQEAVQQQIKAQERVAAVHALRLQRRFEFYYQRLSDIGDKLATRLQTLANEGRDVTAAQANLTNALMLLEEAKEQADASIAKFNSIDPEQYQAQRHLALQARDEAQLARLSFQQVLTQLRQTVQLAMTTN